MKHVNHWFRARKTPSGIEIEGTPLYFSGHKIGSDDAPDGVFAEWSWHDHKLVARNDYYGVAPLFYCVQDESVMLSPSLVRLVAEGAPTELDYPALAVFLRMNTFFGEDTPFKHIRLLPPNGKLEWQDGVMQVTDKQPEFGEQEMTLDQAMDGFIDLFRASISRRLPDNDNFLVPLSGGRDSRHILLELCRQGRKPRECVTIEQDDEALIARRVVDELGIRHRVVRFDGRWFRHDLRKNVAANFLSPEIVELVCLADYAIAKGAHTFYDGIGGDTLLEGSHPDIAESLRSKDWIEYRTPEDVGEAYFNIFGPTDESLKWLLSTDELCKMSRDVAMDRFLTEWGRYADGHDPHMTFFYWTRTRRHAGLSPYCLMSDVPVVYAPFLDRDMFAFLMSVPARFILSRAIKNESMRRAYPEYKHLPWSSLSLDQGGSVLGRMMNLCEQVSFMVRKTPSQLKTFFAGLGIRLDRKSRVRQGFFHYMSELHTLAKPGGAQLLLTTAERFDAWAMNRVAREIAKE